MSFSLTWNTAFEATPPGTEAANLLDTRIQELKAAIRQRTEIEHYWAGNSSDGIHKMPYTNEATRDGLDNNVGQIILHNDASRISYNNGSGWITLDTLAVGDMKIGAYTTPTFGWLLCNGASLERTGTYADLFSAISTNYGTVDSSHFNIPDMEGHAAVGVDSGNPHVAALGDSGGTVTHALTEAQLAVHTHVFTGVAAAHTHTKGIPDIDGTVPDEARPRPTGQGLDGGNNWLSQSWPTGATSITPTGTNANTGSGTAHENMQPSLAVNWFIKYK